MSEGLRFDLKPGMLPPQSIPADGLAHVLNDWLVRRLQANRLKAAWLGEWVACPEANASLQLKLMAEELTPDGRIVRLNSILQIRGLAIVEPVLGHGPTDRKSTRLNSSHANISYAVF